MSRRQQRRERLKLFVLRDLRQHQMTEWSPCRAWTFQRVTEKGAQWCPYGFKLVWTPGMFQLMGDIDELTITHYHAIGRNLRASLQWLHSGEFDYLAGKSSARKEYDQESTVERIWERLLDDAAFYADAYRDEVRLWRLACKEVIEENQTLPEAERMILPDRPGRPAEVDEPFFRLADVLDLSINTDDEPRSVWRKDLRRALMSAFQTESEAAEFTYELFNDFESVSYGWPQNLERQIAAMRFAAGKILKEEFEISWADRVVDWLIKIAPRWGVPA